VTAPYDGASEREDPRPCQEERSSEHHHREQGTLQRLQDLLKACFIDVIKWDAAAKKPVIAYPEECVAVHVLRDQLSRAPR